MNIVRDQLNKGNLQKGDCPIWLPDCINYVTIMGSQAYGTSLDDSDMDIYGWCVPPKELVFPHLAGHIPGFGKQIPRFNQWQKHHVFDASKNREYDFNIYSVVDMFNLAMDNNPNMVESLFTYQDCVMSMSPIARMVREQRRIFLHRGFYHKAMGYAHGQFKDAFKGNTKNPKRAALIEKFGWDTKFGAHAVRLVEEARMVLEEGDLDLRRHSEKLKMIREGGWSREQLEEWWNRQQVLMETVEANSKIPYGPPEAEIKRLLLNCLEHYYGSLKEAVVELDKAGIVLGKVSQIIREAGF